MEDRPPDAPVPPTPPEGFAPPPPPEPPAGFTPPPPAGGYASPPPPPVPPAAAPIPWEDPARPKLAAFFETVGMMYSRTREAYARMPLSSDVLKPYLFAILAGWIGLSVNAVWNMLGSGFVRALMPQAEESNYTFLKAFLGGPMTIAIAPFTVAISVIVSALILHLFLMILGAARSGFAATLRVLCYAQAATLLAIIPFCGAFVQPFIALWFVIVGFSVAHRVTTARAAVAVLLPAVLCCACLTIVFLLVGSTAFNSMRHNMGRF